MTRPWNLLAVAGVALGMGRVALLPLSLAPLLAVASLASPSPAAACSLAGPTNSFFPFVFERSSVVAIGELVESGPDEITLVVTEPFKGAKAGDRFPIYNRPLGLGAGCEVYVEPNEAGPVYSNTRNVVAFLREGQGTGDRLWPTVYIGAIFEIAEDGDDLQPLPRWEGFREPAKVDDVIKAVERHAATPLDPGFESRGPCNPHFFFEELVPDYLKMSTTVVDATLTTSDAQSATLRVSRYLRGAGPEEITVNVRGLDQDANDCSLSLYPPYGDESRFVPGLRFIAFLQPDEFGIAEYRPSVWGRGLYIVRDEVSKKWSDEPTLAGVRAAAGAPGAMDPPPATEEPAGSTEPVPAPSSPSLPAFVHPSPDDPRFLTGAANTQGISRADAVTGVFLVLAVSTAALAVVWTPVAATRLRRRSGRP